MRARRLLLFILVAVNLTLVCQGHAAGGGRTGMHLALLGEPHTKAKEVDTPAPVPIEKAKVAHEHKHVAVQVARETLPTYLPVKNAGRNSNPAMFSGSDHFGTASTLAVALLGIFAGAAHVFFRLSLSRVAWRSSSRRSPEPPPPRLSHVTE